jgi:hypothetical protein
VKRGDVSASQVLLRRPGLDHPATVSHSPVSMVGHPAEFVSSDG